MVIHWNCCWRPTFVVALAAVAGCAARDQGPPVPEVDGPLGRQPVVRPQAEPDGADPAAVEPSDSLDSAKPDDAPLEREADEAPPAGPLIIRVAGAESDAAPVRIALYRDPERFRERSEPFRRQAASPQGGEAVWSLDELPPADYAVAVYQDANQNGQLDKGPFGIPQEPYGFSGSTARRRPPSFEQAKFTYTGQRLEIDIKLR